MVNREAYQVRLADVIRQAKEAGVTHIELHPDGEVKSLSFGPTRPSPKKVSREDELEAEKEARNPRRNAMDLAVELTAENTQRKRVKRG